MAKTPLLVTAEWDEEAKVWVATSDDVPGLATEAESREAEVPFTLRSESHAIARAA
jgi:hypothetical protein